MNYCMSPKVLQLVDHWILIINLCNKYQKYMYHQYIDIIIYIYIILHIPSIYIYIILHIPSIYRHYNIYIYHSTWLLCHILCLYHLVITRLQPNTNTKYKTTINILEAKTLMSSESSKILIKHQHNTLFHGTQLMLFNKAYRNMMVA